jgi:hypothetical protein
VTDETFLDAVGRHWDEIAELAGPERTERLRGLVAGATEPDPVEARAALADELLDLLPADHPLVAVLRSGVMFDLGIERGVTEAELAAEFDRLRARIAIEPTAMRAAELDWFDHAVRARLLALPALTPGEVSRRGGDPDAPDVIRLPTADGAVRVPEFQFGPDGDLLPVVADVNTQLVAGKDPWGATCWWTDEHSRLLTAPLELLSTGRDQLLRAAAADLRDD